MGKGFGKIVLVSSVLAGAAVGTLAYLRKAGVIGKSDSVAQDLADKVSSDAADIIAKERNYVDLGTTAAAAEDVQDTEPAAETEDAAEADAAEPEAKADTAEADDFEPGIKAENIEAADVNTIGSTTSEEFFNDEESK